MDCFLALVSKAGLVVSHPCDIAENSVIDGVQTAILLPAEHWKELLLDFVLTAFA